MHLIPVKVNCSAGYKAEESPRAFWWQDRRIEVEEVVDRWYQGGVDPGQPQARSSVFVLDTATESVVTGIPVRLKRGPADSFVTISPDGKSTYVTFAKDIRKTKAPSGVGNARGIPLSAMLAGIYC